MSSATCAVLAQILPVLLLVSLIEVRVIRPKIRRNKWVKRVVTTGISASFLGMVICVIGVQTDGIANLFAAVLAWLVVTVGVVAFFIVMALISGTIELEAEEAAE